MENLYASNTMPYYQIKTKKKFIKNFRIRKTTTEIISIDDQARTKNGTNQLGTFVALLR